MRSVGLPGLQHKWMKSSKPVCCPPSSNPLLTSKISICFLGLHILNHVTQDFFVKKIVCGALKAFHRPSVFPWRQAWDWIWADTSEPFSVFLVRQPCEDDLWPNSYPSSALPILCWNFYVDTSLVIHRQTKWLLCCWLPHYQMKRVSIQLFRLLFQFSAEPPECRYHATHNATLEFAMILMSANNNLVTLNL